jgi:hypothetical protein
MSVWQHDSEWGELLRLVSWQQGTLIQLCCRLQHEGLMQQLQDRMTMMLAWKVMQARGTQRSSAPYPHHYGLTSIFVYVLYAFYKYCTELLSSCAKNCCKYEPRSSLLCMHVTLDMCCVLCMHVAFDMCCVLCMHVALDMCCVLCMHVALDLDCVLCVHVALDMCCVISKPVAVLYGVLQA